MVGEDRVTLARPVFSEGRGRVTKGCHLVSTTVAKGWPSGERGVGGKLVGGWPRPSGGCHTYSAPPSIPQGPVLPTALT